jgi:hypothetical protein
VTGFLIGPSGVAAAAVGGGGIVFTAGNAYDINHGYSGAVTRTNMNGGVAYPACLVIIGIVWSDGADPGTVAIGGNAMTQVVVDTAPACAIYQYVSAGGVTDTLTISGGGGANLWAVAGCYLTGYSSSTASDAEAMASAGQGDPQNFSGGTNPVIPASGIGIAIAGTVNGAVSPSTISWTNATSQVGASANGSCQIELAISTTPGSWAVAYSGSPAFSFSGYLTAATWA